MGIHSMAWQAVCSGMVGSLLWFGLANPQPFRGGLPVCQSALKTCQEDLKTVDADLKTCQGDLKTVDADLKTCQGDLKTVDADLKTCQEDLKTVDADLKTCQEDLEACPGQSFPATGQVKCWNRFGDEIVNCNNMDAMGHDGNIQSGAQLSYTTDNDNGTVTDNNTGFMWEKLCNGEPGGATCPEEHDVDTAYPWEQAFAKIKMLNAECFAGYCDWRLPNVRELLSTVNYQEFDPAVSPAFNNNCILSCAAADCSCTASTVYWSSTSAVEPGNRTNAWGVSFFTGVAGIHSKTSLRRVRAVRGPGP